MIKVYSCRVYGNQEDPNGNPIPYFRQTQGSRFSKGAKRYQAWCRFLQGEFYVANRDKLKDFTGIKPLRLEPGQTAKVIVEVEWANEQHGDLDNIVKGVNDAIFEDDKQVTAIEATSKKSLQKCGKLRVRIEVEGKSQKALKKIIKGKK